MNAWVLSVQALCSLNLMGIIWCIQRCHYPMFERLQSERFQESLEWHGRRITPLVAPLMLGELLCAFWLSITSPGAETRVGMALVAMLWLSTGLIQVPLHSRLSRERHLLSLHRLVRSNWLRTLGWTLRGLLALWMLAAQ